MKSTEVKISLTMEAEFQLMNIYGRKCSREGLVMRAIDHAIKGNGTPKAAAPVKKARVKKEKAEPKPKEGEIAVECASPCGWTGTGTLPGNCPNCNYYTREAVQEQK